MIIDSDSVPSDNFHSDKIAMAGVEAFPLRQRLNNHGELFRELVPLEIKKTCFAGVRIGQAAVIRAGWQFLGKAVKTKDYVYRKYHGGLVALSRSFKLESARVKVPQVTCDAVVLEVLPVHRIQPFHYWNRRLLSSHPDPLPDRGVEAVRAV